MNKQIALTIDQMRHLQELGLDCSNASMHYQYLPTANSIINDTDELESEPSLFISQDNMVHKYPAFTLQNIFYLLPLDTSLLHCEDYFWQCIYNESGEDGKLNGYVLREGKTALEVCYDMLCWCIENGYIKTK